MNASLVLTFLLLFSRILAFFVMMPLFSYRTIPTTFKIGLSFFLALILMNVVEWTDASFDFTFIILVLKEVFVGLFIGLIAYLIVSALQIAGGFIDFQMGFAVANVIDPQTGAQSPLIGQYFYIFALLFLLSVNGHHLLIEGIFNSYQFIPLDQLVPIYNGKIIKFIMITFNKMFIIAFQIAIPIVGCLFLVDVALGLIARTVPQLNVFVVGLPLKITVSFVALLFFLSIYIVLVRRLYEVMFVTIRQLMGLFGGA